MSKQEGNQSLTVHLLLKDRLLPLEHTNIPNEAGGQALCLFLRLMLAFERALSKVEGLAESSKLCGIFPGLGDHSLELVVGLIGMLMGSRSLVWRLATSSCSRNTLVASP